MAHGTPDWGRTAGTVTTFQLTDLAEAAARLGSINTYDRRGDTVFQDDFEGSVLQWDSSLSGLGASVALDTVWARSPIQCVLLTTGSDASMFAEILRRFPLPATGNLGAEFSFQRSSALPHIHVSLRVFLTTRLVALGIRYDNANNELQYLDATSSWVTFASGVRLDSEVTLFHTMKLVTTSGDPVYVRAIVNGIEYDLSGIAGNTIVGAVGRYFQGEITATGTPGANITARVDDAIITQNEP